MNFRKLRVAAIGALFLSRATACSDEPLGPRAVIEPASVFSVSEPVTRVGLAQGTMETAVASPAGSDGIAYVSLQPRMFPTGLLALVQHPASGFEVTRPMIDGGLDPVAVRAAVGDTIIVVISNAEGAVVQTLRTTAPAARRPIVVRTIPPRDKKDIPLNARMVVVFSEPIRPSTANTIRLLSAGATVGGSVTVSADGLRAEFRPTEQLQRNRDYVLSIPTDVRDADGDALERAVSVQFTTGTNVAVASVNTDQVALITNEFNGQLRVFEMTAILLDDGRVTGSFSVFYPGGGARVGGRVTCFSIVDGRDVWAAGVVDDAPTPNGIGAEMGWHAVDNGPPDLGVPDELSLAIPIQGDLGTAQSFCSSKPQIDSEGNAIKLNNLISGDIVIRAGGEVLPPPQASGMSRIAFAASPDGGIRVMRADGSGVQALSATRGEWNPSWSPDGSRIAFDRGTGSADGPDIYVMNADGSGVRQLTSGTTFDANPVWSPDGRKMAFYRDGSIWVMNAADGSAATKLTDSGAHPSWAPGGDRITFWSGISGKWGVYVMNADGSGLARLTSDTMNASNPAWSPDGRSIAFQGDEGIYIMNANGSNVRRVARGGQTPTWSPDSRMILYEWFGLNVIFADGSGLTKRGNGFTPAWSPVGTMPPAPRPSVSIRIASGDGQTDTVGGTLAQPLSVQLVRDDGTPAAGVGVDWRFIGGNNSPRGTLASRFTFSDASGIATTRLTLPSVPGTVRVQASVTDGTARTSGVEFTATATETTPAIRLVLTPDTATIAVLATVRMSALGTVQLSAFERVRQDVHNRIDASQVTWASSDLSIASIAASGLVTGLREGSMIATATWSGLQATARITVVGGAGDQIAFVRRDDGPLDPQINNVFVMTADGSVTARLSLDDGREHSEPSWSPDGRQIAWQECTLIFCFERSMVVQSVYDYGQGLFNTWQLYAGSPTWSADGSKIAFVGWFESFEAALTPTQIYVKNVDGSGQRVLTSGPLDSSPEWSPDGTRIVFLRAATDTSTAEIFVMGADGSSQRALTSGGGSGPAWSPDGRQIAFVRSGEIFVMNADGSAQRALTTTGGASDNPVWSPDGTQIAFLITDLNNPTWNSDIFVMNADGSSQRALTRESYAPAWSPDGARIAFSRDGQIFVMNADGSGLAAIARGSHPAWRPR